jgi:hypothetical protein
MQLERRIEQGQQQRQLRLAVRRPRRQLGVQLAQLCFDGVDDADLVSALVKCRPRLVGSAASGKNFDRVVDAHGQRCRRRWCRIHSSVIVVIQWRPTAVVGRQRRCTSERDVYAATEVEDAALRRE